MKRLLTLALLFFTGAVAIAQDETSYTDEELTKFATVMVWAQQETEVLKNVVRDSVESWLVDRPLTNARYNDLSKAEKDGDVSTASPTEEELAAYNEIQQRIEAKKTSFKETYVAKIKDDIGAALYNRLNKDLKSNEEIKARYDVIFALLLQDATAGETATADE